uniref:DUF6924 domain-containing protein n=1 Tax=Paractinoplanes polyasparticus TaxID=2856853 RepID=UPI003F6945EE
MFPADADAVLVRTDFADQPAWNDLVSRVRDHDREGSLGHLPVIDDPGCAGLSVSQLLALVPDEAHYLYLAVADRFTDQTVLVVGVEGEDRGLRFRTTIPELALIDINLSIGNMDFADYLDALDDEGAYPGGPTPHQRLGAIPVADDWPTINQLLPGQNLRNGSMPSPSGDFVLVQQDDGDVVIYRAADGSAVWRTGTSNREWAGLQNRLVLQAGGDLVLFEPSGVPVWSSGTGGRAVQRVVVTDDGRLVLLGPEGIEVWSSEAPVEQIEN